MSKRKTKEVEINVDDSQINEEELPKTSKSQNKNSSRRSTNKNNSSNSARNNRNRDRRDNRSRTSNRAANDPVFYNKIKGLLATAPNVVNTLPLGHVANMNYPDGSTSSTPTIPGIMSFDFVPTIGYSQSIDSPANKAINKMYTYLQTTANTNLPFDPADLGLYLWAWDSILMWYNIMQRAYATTRMADPLNNYLPIALLEAQGFDYSDLSSNLANLAFYINLVSQTLSTFFIPTGFDIIRRHSLLCANVWTDNDAGKPQMFVFRPYFLYQYVEADATSPGYCKPFRPNTTDTLMGYEDIVGVFNSMLQVLTQSEDVKTIGAYIIKSFGTDNIYQFPAMDPLSYLVPAYRQEILEQINNMTICPIPDLDTVSAVGTGYQVRQGELSTGSKEGAILQNCMFLQSSTANSALAWASLWKSSRRLNVSSGNYSMDNVLEATRLMFIADTVESDPSGRYIISSHSYGTELVVGATVYYKAKDTSGLSDYTNAKFALPSSYARLVPSSLTTAPALIWCRVAAFDWCPSWDWFSVGEKATDPVNILGNTNEFRDNAVISYSDYEKYNTAAVLSEWWAQILLESKVSGAVNRK